MRAIILLILFLLLIAYLMMFALANPDPIGVNFALHRDSIVEVRVWQLIIGSLLTGVVLTFLVSLAERLRVMQARREDHEELQEMREQLTAEQRQVTDAQAEVERLNRRLRQDEDTTALGPAPPQGQTSTSSSEITDG